MQDCHKSQNGLCWAEVDQAEPNHGMCSWPLMSVVTRKNIVSYLVTVKKVKVKFSLEQATKAQWGSRCTALLFL